MQNRRWTMRAAFGALMVLAAAHVADANTDGLVLRAAGFFEAESSQGAGTCTVPGVTSGVARSSDSIGLVDTLGVPTVEYPDNVCFGWLELQNAMLVQGVSVLQVGIKLKIAGAGRFRQFVPTRNGWPTACKSLRHATVFTGAYLFPITTPPNFGNTGSGAPQVAFVQLQPMVSAQVFQCLREQYGALPSDVYVSLPLVITATAQGITDNGSTVKSNPVNFTLTLNHLCGNGRLDVGEVCDPNAPNTCNVGPCDVVSHTCQRANTVPCATDADCSGTCLPAGDPMECSCVH